MYLQDEVYNLNKEVDILLSVEDHHKTRIPKLVNWAEEAIRLTIKESKMVEAVKPKRGEIYMVHLGENVGCEICKKRPFLVIQSDQQNEKSPLILGVPITSSLKKEHPTHVPLQGSMIKENYANFNEFGTIITEQMRSVSKARFQKKLARLTEEAMEEVEKSLLHAIGINN